VGGHAGRYTIPGYTLAVPPTPPAVAPAHAEVPDNDTPRHDPEIGTFLTSSRAGSTRGTSDRRVILVVNSASRRPQGCGIQTANQGEVPMVGPRPSDQRRGRSMDHSGLILSQIGTEPTSDPPTNHRPTSDRRCYPWCTKDCCPSYVGEVQHRPDSY